MRYFRRKPDLYESIWSMISLRRWERCVSTLGERLGVGTEGATASGVLRVIFDAAPIAYTCCLFGVCEEKSTLTTPYHLSARRTFGEGHKHVLHRALHVIRWFRLFRRSTTYARISLIRNLLPAARRACVRPSRPTVSDSQRFQAGSCP
jgi:hypothetical protein